jgi:hypothetical protein
MLWTKIVFLRSIEIDRLKNSRDRSEEQLIGSSRRPFVSEACFSYLVLRGAADWASGLSFLARATRRPARP